MSLTQLKPSSFDDVCNALKDVHDEASLWHLSDELAKIAPSGVQAVEEVVAEAKKRGIPSKSANTLRLYRDVAIRFPANERVPLVSFSAHREALGGYNGDPKKAGQLLTDLARQHGAEGVTVTTVKKAIGVATGKPAKVAAPAAPVKPPTTWNEVALDLTQGGKKFRGELDAMLAVSGVTLDGVHAGLSAVLADVEARRAKEARKLATSKAKSKAVNPATSPAAQKAIAAAKSTRPAATRPVKPAGKARGDLRGL